MSFVPGVAAENPNFGDLFGSTSKVAGIGNEHMETKKNLKRRQDKVPVIPQGQKYPGKFPLNKAQYVSGHTT